MSVPGRGDSVDNDPGTGGSKVHQRTECGQNLESGRSCGEAGEGLAGQGKDFGLF